MPHKRIRVLLIEDNPGDAKLVRLMLDAAAEPGFNVQHVQDLHTALAQLKSQDFDVLLLDLNLPDSRELNTLGRVHAHDPSTPIIILTGSVLDQQKAVEALDKGARDYLIKGKVDGQLLERAILRCVKVTAEEPAPVPDSSGRKMLYSFWQTSLRRPVPQKTSILRCPVAWKKSARCESGR